MHSEVRKIIHIDMDCFYASIEIKKRPELAYKPVAIGGLAQERGVLSTCNYVARQFGLHSAMSTAQALKRCPDLVLLPVNMPLYREVSKEIQQIFYEYTPLVEPLSLDEAYLDVTDCEQCSGSATWIANEIRQRILEKTGLTASAGVAPLKFLAKIASDYNKPNGIFVIKPDEVADFVKALELSKIPSVGKVTSEKLLKMGLKTCADVQNFEQHILLSQFGKMGQRIWAFSHGIDQRPIQPHRARKSVGVELTLKRDIRHLKESEGIFNELYSLLDQRLRKACPDFDFLNLHKIGVKLKFDDFQTTTLEKSALLFSQENFHILLEKIWQRCQGRKVRLVGLHVQLPEIKKTAAKQMSLWE